MIRAGPVSSPVIRPRMAASGIRWQRRGFTAGRPVRREPQIRGTSSCKSPIAKAALRQIQELYRIEAEITGNTADERRKIRREQALPILDELKTWLSERDYVRHVSLRSTFPDLARSDLYICGPQAWTDLVVAEAKSCGLPDHQIHTERFDW